MGNNKKIIVSSDFSDAPGARYRKDGSKSGEEFYEDLLKPRFLEAEKDGVKLEIDLDNVWGYASSFISGSFGRLSAEFGNEKVMKVLELKSSDDPLLIKKIQEEIDSPIQK